MPQALGSTGRGRWAMGTLSVVGRLVMCVVAVA